MSLHARLDHKRALVDEFFTAKWPYYYGITLWRTKRFDMLHNEAVFQFQMRKVIRQLVEAD